MNGKTKLDEAIKALAEVLPPEAAKALGLEQDAAAPAPPAPDVPAANVAQGGNGDRGDDEDDDDDDGPAPEATKGLAEDGTEVTLLGVDDLTTLIEGVVRTEITKALGESLKGLPERFDRIELGIAAGLEAHKAIGAALELAQRQPAATPRGAGHAVTSFRQPARPGDQPSPTAARLTIDETMKAVDEGLFDINQADRAVAGIFPQGHDAASIRKALNKNNG